MDNYVSSITRVKMFSTNVTVAPSTEGKIKQKLDRLEYILKITLSQSAPFDVLHHLVDFVPCIYTCTNKSSNQVQALDTISLHPRACCSEAALSYEKLPHLATLNTSSTNPIHLSLLKHFLFLNLMQEDITKTARPLIANAKGCKYIRSAWYLPQFNVLIGH